MKIKATASCLAFVISLGLAAGVVNSAEPLRLVRTIPLANVIGRIDHMAANIDGRRLFVAALGNNTIEVIDLSEGKIVGNIGGVREPQGVAFAKDKGLIAVASGEDGTCRFFDSKSMRPAGKIDFHSDADNVRYDEAEKRLYVGYGDGAIGVIEMDGQQHIADVKLSNHPESFQLETNGPRIFVNVPGARSIAVIDRKQSKIVGTWPMVEAQSNFPMALDEAGHRLFVGCRSPAKVIVYDTDAGKLVNSFATVGDTDDLFYDSQMRRLYVCGGEGFIFVHEKQDGDRFRQLTKIPTAPGARTALFVPSMARLYVAVPHRDSQAAEVREYEVIR